MSWTLEEARSRLKTWLDAEAAVATGQSYKLGARQLVRANLREITERISFWRAEVMRLEAGRRPGGRIFSIVPRDF